MYLEIFLADFAVFRVFLGISRKYLNFAGPWPHEISEALMSRWISQFFCNLNSAKKLYLPIGQANNRIHQPDSKVHQPQAIGHYFLYTLHTDVLLAHQAILHNFLGEGTGDKAQITSAREAMTRATLKWSRRGGCDDFIKLAFPHAIEDRVLGTNKFWVFNLQGLYRSWKTWKVMEFKNFIFRAWKVVELLSVLESHGKSKFCLIVYR